MSSRRGHGEGSIYQREADGRWCSSVNLGYVNGKRRRKVIYGRTRKEVADKLKKALHDHQEGLPVAVKRQTVEQFLTGWLDDVARHRVSVSTYEGYGRRIKLDIIPFIGKTALAKLDAEALAHLYSTLLEQGRSARTVQYDHVILHQALEQACRWRQLPRNPTDDVDPPRPVKQRVQTLTEAQVKTLLKAARGDRLEALYTLALATGLRQGELLGLTWADINWHAGVLHIRQQARRTKAHGLTLDGPKTARSRRTVALPAPAIDGLRAHRKHQAEERLAAGAAWTDLDLVFPNGVGKLMEKQNLMRRSFKPLLTRAKLPAVTFHSLRHTHASLLLARGINPKVVQERLGHATVAITLDVYSHVIPSLQQDAADRIATLFQAAS